MAFPVKKIGTRDHNLLRYIGGSALWYFRKYFFTSIMALLVYSRLPKKMWYWAYDLAPEDPFNPYRIPPEIIHLITMEALKEELSEIDRVPILLWTMLRAGNERLLYKIDKMGSEKLRAMLPPKIRILIWYNNREAKARMKNMSPEDIRASLPRNS